MGAACWWAGAGEGAALRGTALSSISGCQWPDLTSAPALAFFFLWALTVGQSENQKTGVIHTA